MKPMWSLKTRACVHLVESEVQHVLSQHFSLSENSSFIRKSGREKWKHWRVTSLQKNAIKLALRECNFSEFFHCFTNNIFQEILVYQLSKLTAETTWWFFFFGQMVYGFTPILRVLTSIRVYICPLFLQFKCPFREDCFHAERR